MKKLLLVAIMAVAGVAAAVAQPRAIGGNVGYGIEASYQHGLGEANMIDLSVNLPVTVPGFASMEISASGAKESVSRNISVSRAKRSQLKNVGVPPPT